MGCCTMIMEKARRRLRLKQWLMDIKSKLTCACGESNPACLDFHHREPATKKAGLARLVRDAYSQATILAEIAKCDVLCANCHRKAHVQ